MENDQGQTSRPEAKRNTENIQQKPAPSPEEERLSAIESRTNSLKEQFQLLPDEDKQKYPDLQKASLARILHSFDRRANFSSADDYEAEVLEKVRANYIRSRESGESKSLTEGLDKTEQSIYANLINRGAFEIRGDQMQKQDEIEANKIRKQLGIPEQFENKEELEKDGLEIPRQKLREYFQRRLDQGKIREATMKMGLEEINTKQKMVEALATGRYKELREADYPLDRNSYESSIQRSLGDKSLPTKKESDWIYRGIMKVEGEGTATRGSLNVEVTPQLIQSLDELIKNGTIRANYKFGELDTGAAADSRHDAITIYFLTEPSPESLEKIKEISEKHFRGNDLLGKKIGEGFYMSEISSISGKQAKELINALKQKDPEIGAAIGNYLTTREGRIAMSEAQYYAVRDSLNAFGIDINFNTEKGFLVGAINQAK